MLQIDVNILDGIYRAIREHPDRAGDIAQSFKANQIISKREVVSRIPPNSRVCVLGGWYAIGFMMTNTDPSLRFTSVDIDPACAKIGKTISAPGYDYVHADALTFNPSKYDVIVNCSTEHMDYDQLQFSFTNIRPGTLCIFQNSNNPTPTDHINCFDTLWDFRKYIEEQFDVIDYSNIKMDNRFDRFTVICTKT